MQIPQPAPLQLDVSEQRVRIENHQGSPHGQSIHPSCSSHHHHSPTDSHLLIVNPNSNQVSYFGFLSYHYVWLAPPTPISSSAYSARYGGCLAKSHNDSIIIRKFIIQFLYISSPSTQHFPFPLNINPYILNVKIFVLIVYTST